MNANPTPSRISGAQLLTKASFADLRSCKFFCCVRLVGAVGVELTTALVAEAPDEQGNKSVSVDWQTSIWVAPNTSPMKRGLKVHPSLSPAFV
jgi:hypothetical protein